jgi:hypothetical protein
VSVLAQTKAFLSCINSSRTLLASSLSIHSLNSNTLVHTSGGNSGSLFSGELILGLKTSCAAH